MSLAVLVPTMGMWLPILLTVSRTKEDLLWGSRLRRSRQRETAFAAHAGG